MYLVLCATLLACVILAGWALHGLYVLSFLSLVYFGLVYMRRDDYTGYAAHNWIRGLRVWDYVSPIELYMTNAHEFEYHTKRPHVFVVLPNATNAALVWTFGLHASAWPGVVAIRPCYIISHVFFWLPIVRDVCMATGAVSDRGTSASHGLEDVVIDLISRGRSVAYCPTGMSDILHVHRTGEIRAHAPSDTLFQMASEHGYTIVPVLCDGEHDYAYRFVTSSWIRRVQQWMLEHIGYPWPLLFFSRCGPDTRRPINVQFGPVIRPEDCPEGWKGMRDMFMT